MPISKDVNARTVAKFDKFGSLSENEVALCFAVKKHSRKEKGEQEFNIFALNYEELPVLYEKMKAMIDNKTEFNFQIAVKIWGDANIPDGHWAFGSFSYMPKENDLKILLCDPVGGDATDELEGYFKAYGCSLQDLNEKGHTTLYLPEDTLQNSPKGCSYFAIDCCLMLSNQNKYEEIYQYMQRKQHSIETVEALTKIKSEFPARLVRGKQSISELSKKYFSDDEVVSKIVNRKGEGFNESVKKNIKPVDVYDKSKGVFVSKERNQRIEMKKSALQKKVEKYLSDPLLGKTLEEIVQEHRIQGFEIFSENKIHPKKPSMKKRS